MSNPVYDPEWDKVITGLSQYCKETGQVARTTLKGGSCIITKKVKR